MIAPEHAAGGGIVDGMAMHMGPQASAAFGHLGYGGGGVGHFLVHLFIWHEIWRFVGLIWRIHVIGPIIVILVIAALIFLPIMRRAGVLRWPGARKGGSQGYGSGTSPRDW